MSETLSEQTTPEQRVFGGAYSIKHGSADEASQSAYFEERIAYIEDDETAWLSRSLDGESGIVADLYRGHRLIATLDYDYETHAADVHTTSKGGNFGDTVLCNQVAFDEAVAKAEEFANTLTY